MSDEEVISIKDPEDDEAGVIIGQEEEGTDQVDVGLLLPNTTTTTDWYCGKYRITAGLGLFVLFSMVIIGVTLFAAINITLDQNVSLWYGVLSLILGVVLEPPKVNSTVDMKKRLRNPTNKKKK